MELRKTVQLVAVGLLLAGLCHLAFGGALACGFVRFDDHGYVYENPVVQAGLTKVGLRWAFTAVWQQWWLPLLWISYMFDSELLGTAAWGYHLTNLLLHATNAGLLAWFLYRLTGFPWRSLAAAALFAVHPLRVESVVWITERKDVLSGLFFFLALLAYLRHVERPGGRAMALVFLGMLLGLMSKATVLVLPFLLLLLDFWPLRRAERVGTPGAWKSWIRLVGEKAPLFLLFGVFLFINLRTHTGGTGAGLETPWLQRLALIPGNVWTYLRLVFWPADLCVYYPASDGASLWRAVAAGAGLVVLTAALAGQARRRPHLLFGWLWFLVALLPVVRGIRLGNAAYADRFTYLPAIGLAVALVWTAAEFAVGANRIGLRRLWAAAAVALVLGLALLSRRQTMTWRDSETLFRRALAVTENNGDIHYNLATVLAREGRWREAAEQYRATLRIAPDYAPAMNNLAWALAADPLSSPAERAEALALVKDAIARSEAKDHPILLNTLERAQAANEEYAAARETARKALAAAESAGDAALAGKIRWRIGFYEARAAKTP